MQKIFGEQIDFAYFDLFADYDKVQALPKVVDFLKQQPPLPVVVFDGDPKFFGGISVQMISDELRSMGLRRAEINCNGNE